MRMFDYIKNSLISRKAEIILVRGSAVNKDLINYGDIDIEVYLSKKPKIESFYDILRYRKKFILLTVYFYYFKDYYKKGKNKDRNRDKSKNKDNKNKDNKNKILKNILVLYDKNNLTRFIDFNKEKPGVPKIIKDYKKRFPRDYQLFLDHYFKLRRLHLRRDKKTGFYINLIDKYCKRFIEKILNMNFRENFKGDFKEDFKNYKDALRLARETYKIMKKGKIDKIIKDKNFNILFKKSEVIFK